MKRVVAIVEGDGDVQALPVLLRRIAGEADVYDIDIPSPIRVRRDKFLNRDDEFNRIVELAAGKANDDGTLLILLDADDDCPARLAHWVRGRALDIAPHRNIAVVIAHREFEAWFLAAAESLAGCRGLPPAVQAPERPEDIRDAKGWLSSKMSGRQYHEVSDQPALSAVFDLTAAEHRSRSFRKLLKEFRRVLV